MIPRKLGLVALAGVWLVSCGDGGTAADKQVSAEEEPSHAEQTLHTIADQCGGLEGDEAAALLGIPAGELEKKVLGEMMDNACRLSSSTQPLGETVKFVLREESSVVAAMAGFDQQAEGFATVVAAEPVEGLGDAAAWYGSRDPVVLDRLLARKGNVWLDVITAPGGLDGARKVAEAVFAKLE
jgi:hypothetical protein